MSREEKRAWDLYAATALRELMGVRGDGPFSLAATEELAAVAARHADALLLQRRPAAKRAGRR